MKILHNDDLLLFSPTIEIIKSKKHSAYANKEMRVRGVASTLDEDSDGEIVDPNGFDVNYLLQSGFINWHHATKDSPSTIIGEPKEAYTKNDLFHVEGILFDFQPLAHEVYGIVDALSKAKTNRKLGWSIEGKKVAENPLNKKHITKSNITGLAITPMPKNGATYLDMVKGMQYDITDEVLANGIKREIVLDIIKGGKRVIVDRGFNIITEDIINEESKHLTVLSKAIKMGMLNKNAEKMIMESIEKRKF